MDLLVPLIALPALWLLGGRFLKPASRAYLPALAAMVAHLLWNIVGVTQFGAWAPFLPDFIFRGLALLWLALRPSPWVALLCGLYTLWSGSTYVSEPFAGHGTNAGMLLLHLFILGALVYGFIRSRRSAGAV
jgi:hypothetical protein